MVPGSTFPSSEIRVFVRPPSPPGSMKLRCAFGRSNASVHFTKVQPGATSCNQLQPGATRCNLHRESAGKLQPGNTGSTWLRNVLSTRIERKGCYEHLYLGHKLQLKESTYQPMEYDSYPQNRCSQLYLLVKRLSGWAISVQHV